MSRDFTPYQTYLVEQEQIKNGYGSLWDFLKNTTVHYNGESFPICSAEELEIRKNYPMLGKLLDDFKTYYNMLASIPKGLEVLASCDNEIKEYLENKAVNEVDSTTIKWFKGELDCAFYYRERNDELFIEYMEKEAIRLSNLKESSLNDKIRTAEKNIHTGSKKTNLQEKDISL